MALEAGITLVNLTESQFGIGTPRSQFPWNLSGTYMQAMPRIYSQDHSGRQYNFLAAYYPTTRMLASAIFRKGYQWPFHAERMLEYGSSLLDVAVYEETQKGAMFFLIFYGNQNPQRTERHSTCKNWMMMSSTICNKITPCWHNRWRD